MPRWSSNQLDRIYQQSEGRCRKCGRPHRRQNHGRTWNVDHVIPRAQGGRDDLANLALSCIPCNSAKSSNMDAYDFAETTANLVAERLRTRSGSRQNAPTNRSGNRGSNRPRSATCPICGRGRNPSYPYCRNCSDKAGGRPIAKQPGECKYGRCHEPVVSHLLGILVEDYCELHLKQHRRGLI